MSDGVVERKYAVFKFSQPAGDFYLATMSASDVSRIAKLDPRSYDPVKLKPTGGIQRHPSGPRIGVIAEYCLSSDAAFPTAVILAIPGAHFELNSAENEITIKGTAELAN